MFLNVPKTCFSGVNDFLIDIMTYPSSLVSQFFVKSTVLYMKQKILIYLCMNAIFSKTMQDTETQSSQFIVEGTANSNMVSKQYLGHVSFTFEMLVFILQLKKFP